MKLKQLLNPRLITEDVQRISAGNASGEYVITSQDVPVSSVLFIPKLNTKQKLDRFDIEQIHDELLAYCELKTGLKFSVNYKYQGVGYAFTVDSYSIIDKLKR